MPKKNNSKLPLEGATEKRAFIMPDIKADAEGNIVQGHAAVFDQKANIGDCFYETIARGAFDKTDFTDVLFSVNHDLMRIPLARSRNNNANSTLELKVDEIGLDTRATLDIENNVDAKALYGSIQRGDINGMSYIFNIRKQEWSDLDTDMPTRTILEVAKVYEVTAASWPAYDGTDINARSTEALDSAKSILENMRAQKLESSNELEIQKLKIQIKLKG